MVPRGAVWQQLRQRALDAVPDGTVVRPSAQVTLGNWLSHGAYRVSAASTKRFTLETSAADVGGAIFADASLHLDHAVEHSTSLRNILSSGLWHSSAWSAVLVYYWAFFLVLALTRITGRSTWFVSQQGAMVLQGLAPLGGRPPGSGPYVFSCGPFVSASQREVILERSAQTRLHDALWQMWFRELRKIVNEVASTGTELESRFYRAQLQAANLIGDSWPSDLRNSVNYLPGVAYGAMRQSSPAAVLGMIDCERGCSVSSVVNRLEENTAALQRGVDVRYQIRTAVMVLIDLCFTLDILAHDLINDVAERRYLDGRWKLARDRFVRAKYSQYHSKPWPFNSSY